MQTQTERGKGLVPAPDSASNCALRKGKKKKKKDLPLTTPGGASAHRHREVPQGGSFHIDRIMKKVLEERGGRSSICGLSPFEEKKKRLVLRKVVRSPWPMGKGHGFGGEER